MWWEPDATERAGCAHSVMLVAGIVLLGLAVLMGIAGFFGASFLIVPLAAIPGVLGFFLFVASQSTGKRNKARASAIKVQRDAIINAAGA